MAAVTFQMIKEAAAAEAGASVGELQLKKFRPDLQRARARAVLLARRLRPDLSVTTLGDLFGGRNSSSIVKAHRQAEALYEADPAERQAVQAVLARLGVDGLPDYRWTACASGRIEPLERLINRTEAQLARLYARRAQLLQRAA